MRYTLFFIILLVGCDLVAPISPDWVKPIDPPLPLVCESYEQIDTPVFSGWFINLDVPLVDTTFMIGNTAIDHETFFDTIYYSGQNIAGFKSGPNIYGSNTVWIRDGNSYLPGCDGILEPRAAKHYLQFISQGMNFRGALTFDQYWNELQTHRSAQFIRFTNTGYTCEQIIQVLNFFLEGCYETPNYVDLRPISIGTCEIPTEIITEYELRGSVVAQ